MMNTNQYQSSVYYHQNAAVHSKAAYSTSQPPPPPSPLPPPPPLQNAANMTNGHWHQHQQMNPASSSSGPMPMAGKKVPYPGQQHGIEQQQPLQHQHQAAFHGPPAYQSQNTYYPRPMHSHSPNMPPTQQQQQQYPSANMGSPQMARNYPVQHAGQRFSNNYTNSNYRPEAHESKNSYPHQYSPANNYNYESPRSSMPAYNHQPIYPMHPPSASYPQRQFIEPRNYHTNMNNDPARMRFPSNMSPATGYSPSHGRMPVSSQVHSPHPHPHAHPHARAHPHALPQMAGPKMNASFNSSAKSPVPAPPPPSHMPTPPPPETVNESTIRTPKKISTADKHLRQALSSANNIPLVARESKLESTVESTKIVCKKVKPLTNIGNVDHRKILMSLKSGLLAETTWAFDCLNILSNNGSFKLSSVPSLLSNLVEYYKCFLNSIFDDLFADTEHDYQIKMIMAKEEREACEEFDSLIRKGEKVFLLDSANYTFKSRYGVPVQVKNEPKFNLSGLCKGSDLSKLEETCDYSFFQDGNNLSTAHIVQNMDPKHELLAFYRRIGPSSSPSPSENGITYSENGHVNNQENSQRVTTLKRKLDFDTEAELYPPNELFCPRRESLEMLIKRCHCISTIVSNLSFMSENARIMSQNSALLLVLARLLSFKHVHLERKTFEMILHNMENKTSEKKNQEASEIFSDFPFDALHLIRMNTFVTLANMSEFLDLSTFSDKIILPLLDSVLHWAVCQSSYAKDPHPPDNLSCQLLVLEIIVKLSMKLSNIDLFLATPPFTRIEDFYKILVRSIAKDEDQVIRELSLVILSNFATADILSARIILHLEHSVFNLLSFVEQFELGKRAQMYSRYNSFEPFTITYMLKHAAIILRTLASECERKDLHIVKRHEERIVELVMSNLLEPEVTTIFADIAYILANKAK